MSLDTQSKKTDGERVHPIEALRSSRCVSFKFLNDVHCKLLGSVCHLISGVRRIKQAGRL